jgi:hypothetical protein
MHRGPDLITLIMYNFIGDPAQMVRRSSSIPNDPPPTDRSHAPGWIEAARKMGVSKERERVLALIDAMLKRQTDPARRGDLLRLRRRVAAGQESRGKSRA